MASSGALQPGVKSALRTLDLIEFVVARPDGVTAQEIAAALAIPMSSLSYLLATLVDRAYLRRDGRRYVAGEGLSRLRRADGEPTLLDRARPILKGLRTRVGETTTLFTLTGWHVEAVLTEAAAHPLRYAIEAGTRAPLHCVAAGKALLAKMPAEELDRYFAEAEREAFTPFTICDRGRLMDAIDLTRARGVAAARDEFTLGITAFAIAIGPAAAISVAGPSVRLGADVEPAIISHLATVAQTIA